jgi:hypothetical protein
MKSFSWFFFVQQRLPSPFVEAGYGITYPRNALLRQSLGRVSLSSLSRSWIPSGTFAAWDGEIADGDKNWPTPWGRIAAGRMVIGSPTCTSPAYCRALP